MKLRIFFLLLITFFTCEFVNAQGFTWNVYTKKDGFKDQATITEIIQDKNDYLWMINGEKLSRFDGAYFTNYYDKSDKIAYMWFKNLIATNEGEIITNNSRSFCKLNPSTGNYEYKTSDSSLSYIYYKDLGGYRGFESFINKDLYKVYSKDHTDVSEQDFLGDTIFYLHNGKTKWCLFQKKNLKRPVFSAIQDKDKNIYIFLNDTINKQSHYYLFNKGKMDKLFVTDIYDNDAANIVKDKNNNYWIVSDNKIQCFNGQKLLKEFVLSEKDSKQGYFSQPLTDSKNNVWISYPEGLVKVNLKGIEKYIDRNRRIPEIIETSYDRNGNEIRGTIKNYRNFFNAFAIDHYDNIISGERIFDGHQFTDISANKNFKDAFDHVKKENLPELYTCFVDKENNIWFGSNLGLIKASPIPFKAIDRHINYKDENYEFRYTDIQNRKYYHKTNTENNEVTLLVFKDDSLQFSKTFKTFKNHYDVYYTSLNSGILWTYKGADEIDRLTFFDGKNETSIKAQNSTDFFSFLAKNNDTAIYRIGYELILFSKGIFKKVNFSSRGKWYDYIRFNGLAKVILSDFTEIIIKPDLAIDSASFLGLKGNYCSVVEEFDNEKKYLLWVPNKDFFLLDEQFKLTKLIRDVNDSIIKKITSLNYYFNDILVASTKKGSYLIFKVNKKTKQISFIRTLRWADGLLNSHFDVFYYLNGYVVQSNEKQDVFRLIELKDFVNGDLTKGLLFENNKIVLSGRIIKNKFNDSIIGGYINYLGKRGINLIKPNIHINHITFIESGTVKEFTPRYKNQINIPYNTVLHIDFKGICLTDGTKLKYKYKLIGLDKDWQDEQDYNATEVKYQTLSPGSYTFQVIARNNHGIWSDVPAEISFTILPPWNRTWWAYCMYVFAGFAAIRGYLKNRTRKLEKEKQKLEKTVEERTAEIVEQKHLIEEKNKEITDSINYAQKIQHTLLASQQLLDNNLNNYFVLFKPKDIVSGDFYWAAKHENGFLIITADCTGHGVPGAFMSLLSISYLNEITKEQKITRPDQVFNILREKIITNFNSDNSENERKDGMDAVICNYNFNSNRLQFAAANNPLWLMRNGELLEYKPDKMPVGRAAVENKPFSLQELQLEKGDIIYTLTDGYADQFGGPKGKKFMYKQMKELIASISHLPMQEQKEKLESEINAWKGHTEQVDDILVIGIRI